MKSSWSTWEEPSIASTPGDPDYCRALWSEAMSIFKKIFIVAAAATAVIPFENCIRSKPVDGFQRAARQAAVLVEKREDLGEQADSLALWLDRQSGFARKFALWVSQTYHVEADSLLEITGKVKIRFVSIADLGPVRINDEGMAEFASGSFSHEDNVIYVAEELGRKSFVKALQDETVHAMTINRHEEEFFLEEGFNQYFINRFHESRGRLSREQGYPVEVSMTALI